MPIPAQRPVAPPVTVLLPYRGHVNIARSVAYPIPSNPNVALEAVPPVVMARHPHPAVAMARRKLMARRRRRAKPLRHVVITLCLRRRRQPRAAQHACRQPGSQQSSLDRKSSHNLWTPFCSKKRPLSTLSFSTKKNFSSTVFLLSLHNNQKKIRKFLTLC